MQRSFTPVALLLLLLAVGAWAGAIYFALSIDSSLADYVSQVHNAQQSAAAAGTAARMHGIAQDTAQERGALAAVVGTDVSSMADILKGASASGVQLTLGSALPESASAAAGTGLPLQAVGFSLQGTGSFAALMQTLRLLEALPLPSHIERLDLQRDQTGKVTVWHLNVYLKVLTSTLSS